MPAPLELVIVDLIAQHNEEAHEQRSHMSGHRAKVARSSSRIVQRDATRYYR